MIASVKLSVTSNRNSGSDYVLTDDLDGARTLEELLQYIKNALILISYDTLKQEQAKGFPADPIVIVDGAKNKSPLNVNPLGSIEFNAKAEATTFLLDIYDSILDRSPVDTGLYKQSNWVVYNNQLVAIDRSSLSDFAKAASFKDSDKIVFLNITPYARKLERTGQTTGGVGNNSTRSKKSRHGGSKGQFILAANGAYYLAARAVKRKYKNNAGIRFGFVSGALLPGLPPLKNPHTGKIMRTTFKKDGRPYLYPSITINYTSQGFIEDV